MEVQHVDVVRPQVVQRADDRPLRLALLVAQVVPLPAVSLRNQPVQVAR